MIGLPSNLRRLRAALQPMRQRGHGWAVSVLWQLPVATVLRAWRRVAQVLNRRLLNQPLNAARFAAFQQGLPPGPQLRAYVIVMPHTLHFLLPCLRLLQGQAPLVLVANGAKAWELDWLQQRLPGVPVFRLRTLPGSSLAHGDVVSLLLAQHQGDFLLVDHDAYVFDATLLQRMRPQGRECLVTAFAQRSSTTGRPYPLTHLLAFQAETLRQLMQRHGIDARLVRRAPQRLDELLTSVGLGPGRYLKDHQRFHDTLHLLLAVAQAEGWQWRLEGADDVPPSVMHVGGTSIGSHHTKRLFDLYIHLRFIDLLDDPLLRRRYAFLTHPLQHADQALQRRALTDPAWQNLPVVHALLQRLQTHPTQGRTVAAALPGAKP
ncbi:MAG: hypothetical protein V4795_11145 [Pseudomonadota bacterium]